MQRLQQGFVLGHRYVLGDRLGAGGMGQVWSANDSVLSRDVAVKVMHPFVDDPQNFLQRFRDEATLVASLSHVNIATLFDYGEDDGLAYLVMERVPGTDLTTVVQREGRMPAQRVSSIISQAALALWVAHEAGIVHRDVKPANIMLTPDGMVKLTDFGIARAGDGEGWTKPGEVLGSPDYLSPEQARGDGATPASDLYALGIVAHELLSGSAPFTKNTPVATAIAHLQDPPPPLPNDVPPELAALVEQCLAKIADQRPASALVVAQRLAGSEMGGLAMLPSPAPVPAQESTGGAHVEEPAGAEPRSPRRMSRSGRRRALREAQRSRTWRLVAVGIAGLVVGAIVTALAVTLL